MFSTVSSATSSTPTYSAPSTPTVQTPPPPVSLFETAGSMA